MELKFHNMICCLKLGRKAGPSQAVDGSATDPGAKSEPPRGGGRVHSRTLAAWCYDLRSGFSGLDAGADAASQPTQWSEPDGAALLPPSLL